MLKKCYLLMLGLVLIPIFSFALNVTLTDSFSRATTGFPIDPSLSSRGKQAYLVYRILVDDTTVPPTTLAAEIFKNNKGSLQTTATLSGDPNFPSVDGGFANPAFTNFTFIDDDLNTMVRIRLFDQNFNLLATSTFNDGDLSNFAFSVVGGEYSPDGQFIALSYINNATNQTSIVRILNAADLSEVTSIQVNGGSEGSRFFTYNNDNYLTFSTCGGIFNFAFENPTAAAPSTLFVYKLKNNQLTLITQASLPQQGNVPTSTIFEGQTLIGIGTARAVLKGEKTIFVNNSTSPSFLPKDNREIRIYRFNGHSLKLVVAKHTGLTSISPVFSPKGLILNSNQAVDGAPGFFNFASLNIKRHESRGGGSFNIVKGTFACPPFAYDVFSGNGRWLLVTGSDQSTELNNINLYRIGSCRRGK